MSPSIKVSAVVDGFRRGGRAWTKEPVTVPVGEFSKDQLAQIRGEKKLTVIDVEGTKEKEPVTGPLAGFPTNAKDLIERIKTADAEQCDLILKDDKRPTVVTAVNGRLEELNPAE